MTDLRQAAQQALEQLDFLNACYPHKTATDTAENLRSALDAAPQAEPVAWLYDFVLDGQTVKDWTTTDFGEIADLKAFNVRPLYAAPQKANAPEGASAGPVGAGDFATKGPRNGTSIADDTCAHDFVLQPSSGIHLCSKCGIGQMKRHTHPAPAPDVNAELLKALVDCRRALEIANFTGELAVVDAAIANATGGKA